MHLASRKRRPLHRVVVGLFRREAQWGLFRHNGQRPYQRVARVTGHPIAQALVPLLRHWNVRVQ